MLPTENGTETHMCNSVQSKILGEKIKKNKRGKKNEGKFHKNGGKGLKIESLCKLIRRGKKIESQRRRGGVIEMHNIYPW